MKHFRFLEPFHWWICNRAVCAFHFVGFASYHEKAAVSHYVADLLSLRLFGVLVDYENFVCSTWFFSILAFIWPAFTYFMASFTVGLRLKISCACMHAAYAIEVSTPLRPSTICIVFTAQNCPLWCFKGAFVLALKSLASTASRAQAPKCRRIYTLPQKNSFYIYH